MKTGTINLVIAALAVGVLTLVGSGLAQQDTKEQLEKLTEKLAQAAQAETPTFPRASAPAEATQAAAAPVAEKPAAADTAAETTAPAPTAAEDEKKAKTPDLQLDFKPNSFQINSYASYDDDGHVQSQQQNCTLYVKAFYNPSANPVGYSNLQLTRIIADNGAQLAAPNNSSSSSFNISRSSNRPYFGLSLQLPYPPAAATGFTEISGTMNVQVGVGPIKRAVLPPMKDVEGNTVHIEGLGDKSTDVWIKVTVQNRGRGDNQQLRMEMTTQTFTQVSEIKMSMPQGDTITLQNGGHSSNGQTTTRYFTAPIADDSRIVIEFYNKIEEIPAKFSLYGLPLPGTPGRSPKDIVIQAVDAATAAANPGDQPGATVPVGDLKTTIEKADN